MQPGRVSVLLVSLDVCAWFQLTLLIVQVSILYYGGHLVISEQMTSGNLISFIIYEFVLGDCMEVRLAGLMASTVSDLDPAPLFLGSLFHFPIAIQVGSYIYGSCIRSFHGLEATCSFIWDTENLFAWSSIWKENLVLNVGVPLIYGFKYPRAVGRNLSPVDTRVHL